MGEILPGVIDHLTRPQRFHQFQVCAAAHPGHVGPEVAAGKLDRIRADRAGSAVNQDFLSGLDFSLFETLPGCHPCAGDGGGLLVGEIGRFERQHPVFGQAFVLGIAAKIDGEGGGENRVAGFEAGHLPADGFNFPGQFHPQDRAFGSAPSQDKTRHELLPARDGQVETAHDRVADGDGGGMDFDQHFPVPGRGFFHSLSRSTSGGPYFVYTIAFIFIIIPFRVDTILFQELIGDIGM